jgi:dihydrofolate reductase
LRRLVAVEMVSLDGVMGAPDAWAFPYNDHEIDEVNAAGMAASDALLLGRVTYEAFASFWPNQPGGTPIVDYINGVAKYVVSTTLEEPLGWNNSSLIGGDAAEGVAALKGQDGKDITIVGSDTLARSMLRENLLDELRLMVYPVVVGTGKRLFEGAESPMSLELVQTKTFGNGVVSLDYRPAGEGGEG